MAKVYYRLSSKIFAGKAEILMRLHGGRDMDQRAKTGIYVDPALWDAENMRLKISRRFVTPATIEASDRQKELDSLSAYVENRFIKERSKVCAGWLQATIYEFLHGSKNEEADQKHVLLADMCEKYTSNLINPSSGVVSQYNMIANLLRRYARDHAPIYIDTMSEDDLDDLVEFMREEKIEKKDSNGEVKIRSVKRSQNTINTKLKKLHAVFALCKKKKLISSTPFDNYSIPDSVYGDPTFLTIEERDAIYAYKDLSPAKAIQRDIFIFQCYIGCRISDLMHLKKSNIVERNGIMFCDYCQIKLITENKDVISVPLSSVAIEIIDRYKDCKGDQLLPFISSQKYNDAIKDILREIGINRNIVVVDSDTRESRNVPICDISSSHLARRTFTQHVFSATKSERIAAELTGHAEGSRAMKRYTKLDDSIRKDVIGLIDTKKIARPSQAELSN